MMERGMPTMPIMTCDWNPWVRWSRREGLDMVNGQMLIQPLRLRGAPTAARIHRRHHRHALTVSSSIIVKANPNHSS